MGTLLLTKVHHSLRFSLTTLIPEPVQGPTLHMGSSWLWRSLRFSLFLVTLTCLRSIGQVFCKAPLNWDSSNVFLMIWLGSYVFGGRPQKQTAILLTSYQGYMLSTWLITVDINLAHLAEVEFFMFLQWEVIAHPPFQTVIFGRKSVCAARA